MLDDHSPMPFGIHKGIPMANVPDEYLLHIWEKYSGQSITSGPLFQVLEYINDFGIENLKK